MFGCHCAVCVPHARNAVPFLTWVPSGFAPLTAGSAADPCFLHAAGSGRFDAAASATAEINESDEDEEAAEGEPERHLARLFAGIDQRAYRACVTPT